MGNKAVGHRKYPPTFMMANLAIQFLQDRKEMGKSKKLREQKWKTDGRIKKEEK